jgi:hypothetical protein
MRGLSFPAILLLISCAATGSAAAQTDSTVAATRAAAHAPVPVLVLLLEHGVTRDVTFIKPRSDGMAAVTGVDGRADYIPLYKIQHIEDARGEDRTAEVLRKGHSLGALPPKPDRRWRKFRTLAGPRSVCGSYLITDTAFLWQTSATPEGSGSSQEARSATLDYGYARNVGDASSVGATGFLEADGDRVRSGVRLRLVRWIGPDLSLDVDPGIVLLADEKGPSSFQGPGFSSQAGLTYAGRIGVVAQVSSVSRRESSYLATNVVHQTDWNLGLRTSGDTGIFGTAILVSLVAIALGSL